MRKIFFILFILVTSWEVLKCQPIVNRSNNSITVQDARLAAQYNLLVPRYADTTAANVQKGIDSLGAVIYTYNTHSLWVRSYDSGKKWVEVAGGGGGGATWGSITGTLSNQTDLQAALDAKQNTITFGTGVQTALGVNIGSAGAPVLFNGAGGTPSSMVGTNITGTASGLSIGGNAATATALQTGRTIAITGDLTYTSPSFDGSGNVTASGTLATVNSNVGTFGSSVSIPTFTVNAKGLITAASGNAITIPTASLLPVTGTGTATGAVIGSLAGNTLNIQQGANSFLTLDPTTNAEVAQLRAYNTTNNDNFTRYQATTTDTDAEFLIQGIFNGGDAEFSINGNADVSGSSLNLDASVVNYTATSGHQFTGNVGIGVAPTVLFQVQSGGVDLLSIDPTAGAEASQLLAFNTTGDDNFALFGASTTNTGTLTRIQGAFNGAVKESKIDLVTNSTDATIEYTADTHTFTVGGNTYLSLAEGQSDLIARDPLNSDTRAYFQAFASATAQSQMYSDYNDAEEIASITALAQSGSATIAYVAVDGHTFTGNILTATDNTYDIGSSSASFKDGYFRSLILDGSTAATVTIVPEASSRAVNMITASGTGYGVGTMISRLTSAHNMSDVNTVQSPFPTTGDVWTLQGNTTYYFEGFYYLTHGATSHSVGMSFELAGGASLTSIHYTTIAWPNVTAGTTTTTQTTTYVNAATNTAINSAGANAAETIRFWGFMSVNAGGTVTPSITFSAAPGGAPAAGIGTYITFTPIGSGTIATLGNVN